MSMRVDLWTILGDTGPFARIILVVLFIFSVISWAIMLERGRYFAGLRRDSERFFTAARKAAGAADVFALAARERNTSLGRLGLAGQRELSARWNRSGARREGESRRPLTPEDREAIRRALDAAALEENARHESRLSFLATTGSVMPFVGLLGTVWGVMTAFFDMGRQGQANLAVVAPGIAEALIATAAGLGAAIPAVMGYNFFVGKVRTAMSTLETFSLEFMNLIDREYGP
jgi:biopolymer transport protein TolQ